MWEFAEIRGTYFGDKDYGILKGYALGSPYFGKLVCRESVGMQAEVFETFSHVFLVLNRYRTPVAYRFCS